MNHRFARRMNKIPRSFVREILKVTDDEDMISFAGGLPNPQSFPVEAIKNATSRVLTEDGEKVLQYSTTEGYRPLRELIAQRYEKQGLQVEVDDILITNGSQQCLDLVGKVFLDRDDGVVMERPTYLAAIQAFGLYEPQFHSVPLLDDGVDTEALEKILKEEEIKLFYSVTSFQNPTGITYSRDKRREVAEILTKHNTILVEDNPYGEIRFMGEDIPPIKSMIPDSILFGTFSKIVSPGMRMGWIVAPPEVMEKLVTAKQASDLHSNYFTQRVVYQYLQDNNVDNHIQNIRKLYKSQRDQMVQSIREYLPEGVKHTAPEGGMFLWVTLPEGMSSMDLFKLAIKEKVAFVPGETFYTENPETNTMRLNFSNCCEEEIIEGMKRLGTAIQKMEDL
ncbi:PLP-dependent aminotransferase family protein [Methanobacterium subterraneum]|uniref:PLP-dependent aminotransferase family protein n=1 Tax=Methanobacterium subterraneum TaxID=59277 RepID=A0A7K4DLX4_9EURY|nr:PLP-dependent aminotransferase family protein [Methanobacterium subterraneum]MBW4257848.1 PLP-dependent aminotransferase family protein [Methanobacterium sp. YSL]NMO09473.1 PLP-dependent aminotransferase family protein [Methanobacterium subterraneum]